MTKKLLLLLAAFGINLTIVHGQIDTVLRMDHSPTYDLGGIIYDEKNNVLFAMGTTHVGFLGSSYGLWRSTDGGVTFELTGTGFPSDLAYASGPLMFSNGEYLLIDTESNERTGLVFYRSSDQGRTFQPDGQVVKIFRGVMKIRDTVLWGMAHSLLSLDAGRTWSELQYPFDPEWGQILSGQRIAIGSRSQWSTYDARTGQWTALDIPASFMETKFQLVDDSTYGWIEDGKLMIGAGSGGPKKRIDSMYVPRRREMDTISLMDIFKHRDRIVVLDHTGAVALLDGDSLVKLTERTFAPSVPPMMMPASIQLRVDMRTVGGRDVAIVYHPTKGWGGGVDIEIIDIGQRRVVRSMYVPYLTEPCNLILMSDMTVVIDNQQGELVRMSPDSGSWTLSTAAERAPEKRRKCGVYDGHVLSDGTVLALTEYGRWIRNDRATGTLDVVSSDGSKVGILVGFYFSEYVAKGYPRAERYGDTLLTTGSAGVRMSIDGTRKDTIRDSLTTYAYRDANGRLYLGARDVRWTPNDGQTWIASNEGLPYRGVNVRPTISKLLRTASSTMIVGLRGFEQSTKDVVIDSVPGGIYYSGDDGISWIRADGLGKRDYVFNIAEVGSGELLAVVGHVITKVPAPGVPSSSELYIQEQAIARSTDGGRTWQIVFENAGQTRFTNHHGSIIQAGSNRVIALMSSNAVVVSRDNGEHWDYESNSPLALANIHALDADESGRLHYFTDHGVFRQSTPTSVEDGVTPRDVSMNVHVADGILHGSFDVPDVMGTTITIIDLQGRAMRSFGVEGEFTTSVADLSSGLYVVMASGRWGRASQSVMIVH